MSSDPHAYDALGRIFSEGGEQSYALAISRGYSPNRIDAIMSRRFGEDYGRAAGVLSGFAAAMLAAGALANRSQSDGTEIDPSQVPINEFLPDDELAGNRYKWTADVTFEGTNSPVTVYFYTIDLDVQNAVNEAISGGGDIVDNYRSKFGLSEIADLTPLTVEFISIQADR